MISHWRASFQPIIRDALAATKGKSEKEIRKAIVEAYPLSERKYWPYKVWCDEVRVQRGKRALGVRTRRKAIVQAGQQELFEAKR